MAKNDTIHCVSYVSRQRTGCNIGYLLYDSVFIVLGGGGGGVEEVLYLLHDSVFVVCVWGRK